MSGFGNSNPNPDPIRIDNSHVSGGFMDGRANNADAPITQKINAGGQIMRIDTQVDHQGNVGDSVFRPGNR